VSATSDASGERPDLDVRVLRGAPTDEELAAVLAVVQALAATPRPRATATTSSPSAWDRSRRDLRAPLPETWR
jgi:Acyl-CoA carboxylase epsilon subunit